MAKRFENKGPVSEEEAEARRKKTEQNQFKREKRDFYAILGLKADATSEEIKKAGRELSMKHHPDRGGDPQKMQEISSAYNALGDADRKKLYDQEYKRITDALKRQERDRQTVADAAKKQQAAANANPGFRAAANTGSGEQTGASKANTQAQAGQEKARAASGPAGNPTQQPGPTTGSAEESAASKIKKKGQQTAGQDNQPGPATGSAENAASKIKKKADQTAGQDNQPPAQPEKKKAPKAYSPFVEPDKKGAPKAYSPFEYRPGQSYSRLDLELEIDRLKKEEEARKAKAEPEIKSEIKKAADRQLEADNVAGQQQEQAETPTNEPEANDDKAPVNSQLPDGEAGPWLSNRWKEIPNKNKDKMVIVPTDKTFALASKTETVDEKDKNNVKVEFSKITSSYLNIKELEKFFIARDWTGRYLVLDAHDGHPLPYRFDKIEEKGGQLLGYAAAGVYLIDKDTGYASTQFYKNADKAMQAAVSQKYYAGVEGQGGEAVIDTKTGKPVSKEYKKVRFHNGRWEGKIGLFRWEEINLPTT